MRCKSHLDVDLASTKVEAALEALNWMKKLSHKVKSAHVHAKGLAPDHKEGKGTYGRVQFDTNHLQSVFEGLRSLPSLQSLTVELNYHVVSLPVAALIAVLRTKRLRKLHLKHLQLIGCGQEFEELDQLLQEQTQLEVLTLHCCRGVSAVRSLVQRPPHLKELRIINTALAPYGTLPEDALVQLLTRQPHLRVLRLDDVPELEDSHIQNLAWKLAAPDATLQEFHLFSNMLTDQAGTAMADVLLTNTSLQKVSLHLDAEQVVRSMANALKYNTTLQSLDMRLCNDHNTHVLTKDAKKLANALVFNTSLQHLRLRLEMDLQSLPLAVVEAFHTTLQKNQTLCRLSLDDGAYRYPLPRPLKLKLELNQAHVPALLKQVNAQPQLVEALIQTATGTNNTNNSTTTATDTPAEEMNRLDMIYHILNNSPSLLLNANCDTITSNEQQQQKVQIQEQETQQQQFHHALQFKKVSDWKLPSFSKTLKRKSTFAKNKLVVPRVA